MEFIDNQPFIFQTRNEYQLCKKDEVRCNLMQPGDRVCVQVKNPPCSGTTNDLVCDNEFAVINSGNKVANGDFFSGDSGWTVGATWSYNLGVMHAESVDTASSLSQTLAEPLVAGGCYLLKFTITNHVSGDLIATLGGTDAPTVSDDGEYSFLITTAASDDDIFFTPSPAYDFDLDNVQIYYLGECWCADNGNISPRGGTGICHTPGAETIVGQVTPPLTGGTFYKIYISIRNMTAGEVRVRAGYPIQTVAFTTNGDHTDYLASGGTDLSVWMSSDFDGCVISVGVVEYNRSNGFFLIDEDENEIFDFSSDVTYYQDRAFFCFDMSDIRDGADQPFPYGCYRLKLVDFCSSTEHISNCLLYAETFPGTRQIIANDYVDGDYNVFRYAHGFLWAANLFTLTQRVDVSFRKATQKTVFDGDRFSTGERYKSYSEQSKWWEMAVLQLGEDQHDCLALQVQLRNWTIDAIAYYTSDEEYSPEYDTKGYKALSDVRMLVSRKQGITFSDNCSR